MSAEQASASSADASLRLPSEAAAYVDALGLVPLEHEGGLFRQTYIDEFSTAIYFLVAKPDFSALHLLSGAEGYFWHAGSPLELLLLHPDGTGEQRVLGPDVVAGEQFQTVVPGGIWQGSSPRGEWSLVSTTMAPGFDWDGFRLGKYAELSEAYPEHAERIAQLTRG